MLITPFLSHNFLSFFLRRLQLNFPELRGETESSEIGGEKEIDGGLDFATTRIVR